jgi:hypothetical protein
MQNRHDSSQVACSLRCHYSETTILPLLHHSTVLVPCSWLSDRTWRKGMKNWDGHLLSCHTAYSCMWILFWRNMLPPFWGSLVSIHKTTMSQPRTPSPEYLPPRKPENSQLRNAHFKTLN